MMSGRQRRLIFLVSEDWYFYSHRLPIAMAALRAGFDVHLITRVTDGIHTIPPNGLTVHSVDVRRGSLNPFHDLRFILRLIRIIVVLKPDILHNVALKPAIYGSIAAAIGSRHTQVINALGGLGFVFTSQSFRARLLRPLVVYLLRISLRGDNQRLILQNLDDIDLLVQNKVARRQDITLIRGSGVDPDLYIPHEPTEGPPVVAFAARLLKDKGIHEFVGAVALLRQRNVEARFVLVGSPDRDNPSSVSEQQCSEWTVCPGLERWGWSDNMPQTLSRVDIMVLPSYREGLPKSLLEAASCALPIVTCDTPGCRDVVITGHNGYLVPVRSVAPLADAIHRLLQSPEERRSMGANGRRLVERHFSLNAIVDQTMALYRSSVPS